jgi:SAM-dependent methyltransferase
LEPDEVRQNYNKVAETYAAQFYSELSRKEFDCGLLDAFAADCAGQGKVLDVGCGPGHIGRYLQDRGVDVKGIDLSDAMVDAARRLNPGMEFAVGDMRHLDTTAASLAGITAFYSIIHIPAEEAPGVMIEFARALRPGGRLLFSAHGGSGVLHRDDFLGHDVHFMATLFQLEDLRKMAEAAGLVVDFATERGPYEFEFPTPRLYISARKPG